MRHEELDGNFFKVSAVLHHVAPQILLGKPTWCMINRTHAPRQNVLDGYPFRFSVYSYHSCRTQWGGLYTEGSTIREWNLVQILTAKGKKLEHQGYNTLDGFSDHRNVPSSSLPTLDKEKLFQGVIWILADVRDVNVTWWCFSTGWITSCTVESKFQQRVRCCVQEEEGKWNGTVLSTT